MEKPEFVINTEKIYKSFYDEIESIRNTGKLENHIFQFDEIVVSAYVKCYDFMLYLCDFERVEDSYFQLPFLRGIYEDLISISYLFSLSEKERNSIILCNQIRELKNTLKCQEDYFKKYNPAQSVVPQNVIPELKSYIEHYNENGIEVTKKYFLKINRMSKKVGLEDLHNYFYRATSNSAHFNIFNLLAMGWGEMNEDKRIINPTYSHKNNFHQYYKFLFFYTSIIFINQTKNFSSIVDKSTFIESKLKPLEEGYKLIDWPEIISFEQMNLKRPNGNQNMFFRAFMNILNDEKKDKNGR